MAHLHLLLNHIPIEGAFVVLVFLLWGLVRRSEPVTRAALFGVLLLGFATLLVFFTGDAAMVALESATFISKDLLQRHDDRAGLTIAAALVTAALAGVALVFSDWSQAAKQRMSWLVAASLSVTFLLANWTASAGNVIRHDEIRDQPHTR